MRRTGFEQLLLVGKVPVDSQPLDACLLRDGADGGVTWTKLLMQAGGGLDDPASCFLLGFRPLF